jgi:hypothetical protein
MPWRIESAHEVAATPEAVYQLYTDPATWAHHTRSARTDGALDVGSTVDVTDGFGHTWHVRIERLEPDRHMTCVNRDMGFVITSTYDVTTTPHGCRIHHVIELGGPLELLYRPLQPVYGRLLRNETRRLAALAREPRPGTVARPD